MTDSLMIIRAVGWNVLKICFVSAAFCCAIPAAMGQQLGSAPAQPPVWQQVGTLDCTIGPSIGLVMGGRQHARCAFKRDEASTETAYVGRLEKASRTAGLPSGGRLTWSVFAASPAGADKLVGEYRTAAKAPGFAEQNAYTMCQGVAQAVCLQPVVGGDRWKPNLAPTVSRIKLETSMRAGKGSRSQ